MRRFTLCLLGAFLIVVLPTISWRYFGWLETAYMPGWLAIAWLEHLDLITVFDWRGDVTDDGEALVVVAAVVFWAMAGYACSLGLARVDTAARKLRERAVPGAPKP